MSIIRIVLGFDGMNISAQVGDTAYYSFNSSLMGGFETSILGDTIKLGKIVGVNVPPSGITLNFHLINIVVEYDDDIVTNFPAGPVFISFVKDKKINTSSLLGYYADVKFVNDSRKKAELFSVGSEIVESSK